MPHQHPRWSVMVEGDRIVSIHLPIGAVISHMDMIAMGPRATSAIRAWCTRHGRVLETQGDDVVVVDPHRRPTVADLVLHFIRSGHGHRDEHRMNPRRSTAA